MLSRSDRRAASAELGSLGVFLTGHGQPANHAGMLFRNASGQVISVEYNGGSRPAAKLVDDQKPIHWAEVGLDDLEKQQLLLHVELVSIVEGLKYSPDLDGCHFQFDVPEGKAKKKNLSDEAQSISNDDKNLNEVIATFLPGGIGSGLTCATFIALFFENNGHQLLDLTTWSIRPDDAAWQLQVITACCNANLLSEEEVAQLLVRGPFKRMRPAEVVGAAIQTANPLPLSMAVAINISEQLIANWEG